MNTIQQDLDDLDRMVDSNAAKDAIRGQIRLISREVSALEAEYAGLADSHTKFQESTAKVISDLSEQNAKLKKPPYRGPFIVGGDPPTESFY